MFRRFIPNQTTTTITMNTTTTTTTMTTTTATTTTPTSISLSPSRSPAPVKQCNFRERRLVVTGVEQRQRDQQQRDQGKGQGQGHDRGRVYALADTDTSSAAGAGADTGKGHFTPLLPSSSSSSSSSAPPSFTPLASLAFDTVAAVAAEVGAEVVVVVEAEVGAEAAAAVEVEVEVKAETELEVKVVTAIDSSSFPQRHLDILDNLTSSFTPLALFPLAPLASRYPLLLLSLLSFEMVAEAEAAEGEVEVEVEVGADVEAEVDEHLHHHLLHHLYHLLLLKYCSLGNSLPRPTTETKRDEAKSSGLSTTPHVHHHTVLLLLLLLHSLLRRNEGQSLQSNDTTSANDRWLVLVLGKATYEREREESEEGMREILLGYAVRQDDGITERNQTKHHFFIPTRLSFDSASGCGSPSLPVHLLSDFTFSDSNSNPSNSNSDFFLCGGEPSALSSSSARPSGSTCQRVVEDIENSEVHSQSQSQLQSQSQAQSYSSLLPLLEFLTSHESDGEVYIETPADDGGEGEGNRPRRHHRNGT
ncbi:hypothetical protein F5879DRAFT_993794 [Lentinula edodes]|nr:hypothetical protein F5879DRAFT_993794 [Lentinula edodes]